MMLTLMDYPGCASVSSRIRSQPTVPDLWRMWMTRIEDEPLRLKRSCLSPVQDRESLTPAFEQERRPPPILSWIFPLLMLCKEMRKKLPGYDTRENRLVIGWFQRYRAEDLAQVELGNVLCRALSKEMDDLMMRIQKQTGLNLMQAKFCSNPALASPSWNRKKRALAELTNRALKLTTHLTSDDHDSAGGGSSNPAASATPMTGSTASNPAGGTFAATGIDSTVPTTAALDSAASRREIGVSPFVDSADSSSPSNVLLESTSGGILDFFLDSDEEERIAIPDDKLLIQWLSSENESDDDMENYIPPLPYGEFKDWEKVSCPQVTLFMHVIKSSITGGEKYFRLNPDVNIGLDLWRDVNMLCQSLHSDDVEDFWRTQDEWIVSSWKLYPKSSVHVLDLTNGKTVYMFVDKFYPIRATLLERMLRHRLTVPPSYCRDVVVAGNIIQTVQTGLRQSYECLASAPIACTARQMVFSSPWLTAKKESGSPLQTALVCNSNPYD
ncbi:hypothetical protein Tco_0855337 [Tanacetum coccineum]